MRPDNLSARENDQDLPAALASPARGRFRPRLRGLNFRAALTSRRVGHAAAVLFFVALALWLSNPWLRNDLFIYGDYPGQFFRAWSLVDLQWPDQHRLFGWNPYWYAGYPELQFYPPGASLFVLALKGLGLGMLPTVSAFELSIVASYVFPALTFYYALVRLGFNQRAAFLAGLFGLTFPGVVGGYTSVMVGMLGTRLSFGLDALVFAWGICALRGRENRWTLLAMGALALEIYTHPYHAINIAAGLGIYALVFSSPRLRSLLQVILIGAGAAALDGMWLLPLLGHSDSAIATIQATFDQAWRQLFEQIPIIYFPLAAIALLTVRRSTVRTLGILAAAIAAFVFFGHVVLIDRLQIYRFDPVRFIGEYNFSFVWLAAIGADRLLTYAEGFYEGLFHRSAWASRASGAVLVLISVVPAALSFQEYWTSNPEPHFLSEATRSYKLNEFWDTLRGKPGRVLFTSFYTQLHALGGEPFPTTIASLTPFFSSREIIGGTFTHWSPIAADVVMGRSRPPALEGLVELQDDVRLFGMDWASMQEDTLLAWCQRLDISTVVATSDDVNARTFLDASQHFRPYYNNGLFFLYRLEGYVPAPAQAQNADVTVTKADSGLDIHVAEARPGAVLNVKTFDYPLWTAAAAPTGTLLHVSADRWRLIRVDLPVGSNYDVILTYKEGLFEFAGYALTLLAAAVYIGAWANTFGLGQHLHAAGRKQPALDAVD